MSTLWTPGGEHRIPRPGDEEDGPATGRRGTGQGGPRDGGGPRVLRPVARWVRVGRRPDGSWEPTPEEARQAQEELDEMRQQLAQAPAELVIANHAMGLWELARPPPLATAAPAAAGAAGDRRPQRSGGRPPGSPGEDERSLREGLAQLTDGVRPDPQRRTRPSGGFGGVAAGVSSRRHGGLGLAGGLGGRPSVSLEGFGCSRDPVAGFGRDRGSVGGFWVRSGHLGAIRR